MERLNGNIWKYFVYLFSQRRHFIPLLAIYFLTLPDTTAKQIGLYTGIGYAASFFIEVPSSYFADRVGHKLTLIIAKVFMVLSTLLFILADRFWYFAAGSACMAISTACSGGVGDAFMHDTMRTLKRESDYTKIMSKIKAYVSLLSGILIVFLPLLTLTSMLLPFYIVLAIDIIGLIVVSMLQTPNQEQDTTPITLQRIMHTLRTAVKPGFYPLAIFTSAITGFLVADSSFRYVYLQSLGYPIIFIGAVMGISRFVWFLIAQNIQYLQRVPLQTLITIELFLFPINYMLIAVFDNPYVVGALFSVIVGYQWARDQLYTTEFIQHYIIDKKYKATMLSVTTQIDYIFQMVIAFSIGGVMEISYKNGFLTLSVALFCVLVMAYAGIRAARNRQGAKASI